VLLEGPRAPSYRGHHRGTRRNDPRVNRDVEAYVEARRRARRERLLRRDRRARRKPNGPTHEVSRSARGLRETGLKHLHLRYAWNWLGSKATTGNSMITRRFVPPPPREPRCGSAPGGRGQSVSPAAAGAIPSKSRALVTSTSMNRSLPVDVSSGRRPGPRLLIRTFAGKHGREACSHHPP